MTSPTSVYTPFVTGISAITQANPAVITTSVNHGFVIGNEVTFQIPNGWGMLQLNGLSGYITAISSNTITVNINTSTFDAFVVPATSHISPAQVIPAGDANFGYQSNGNIQPQFITIPGANVAPTI